jgi:hypothetical protein
LIKLTETDHKRELLYRLTTLATEVNDARYKVEELDNPREAYYLLDYLIKDAQALRNYMKSNKLV